MKYSFRDTGCLANSKKQDIQSILAIIMALLTLALSACRNSDAEISQLQDTVDATSYDRASSELKPGRIVEHEARGDWVYVRTEGAGTVGYGELIDVSDSEEPDWDVLTLVTFRREGNRLGEFFYHNGGDEVRERARTLNPVIDGVGPSKWQEYLRKEGLSGRP